MSRLRVHCFSVSLDGYGAGAHQDLANPLGEGGDALHTWMLPTRTFQTIIGNPGGITGLDDDFVSEGFKNVGAWILGRNMFGPIRGEWPDQNWKGWWGDDPPYHTPVYVLTHHGREPLVMAGGTTFHFVTDGIHSALDEARRSADGKDVRLGGGAGTLRQYLEARLIDEMHLAISPVLLGQGEPVLAGIDLPKMGYAVACTMPGTHVTHVVISKTR